MVTGGKRSALGDTLFEPTVLTDVMTDMVITKEETFGPVAPLYRFKTDAEAIKMATDAEFGLAAYFRHIAPYDARSGNAPTAEKIAARIPPAPTARLAASYSATSSRTRGISSSPY